MSDLMITGCPDSPLYPFSRVVGPCAFAWFCGVLPSHIQKGTSQELHSHSSPGAALHFPIVGGHHRKHSFPFFQSSAVCVFLCCPGSASRRECHAAPHPHPPLLLSGTRACPLASVACAVSPHPSSQRPHHRMVPGIAPWDLECLLRPVRPVLPRGIITMGSSDCKGFCWSLGIILVGSCFDDGKGWVCHL